MKVGGAAVNGSGSIVGNSQFYTGIAHSQPTPGGAVVGFLHTAHVLKVFRQS